MSTSVQTVAFQNAVLRSLGSECIERLRLKPVRLEAERRIVGAGDPMRWLLFLESGSVALGVPLRDGSVIETGILGNRSLVCATALLGARKSLNQVTVRSPGHGFVCPVEQGIQEFGQGGAFHDLALGCLHVQLMQATQIAACNRCHDVEQRLCRWMLDCHSESAAPHIPITQEDLAEALGVRRTTITVTMHQLRIQNVVDYSRGRIRLIDKPALELLTCECYEALRKISGAAALVRNGLPARFGPRVAPEMEHRIHAVHVHDGQREMERLARLRVH